MGNQEEIKAKTPEKALDVLRWMCSRSEKTKQDCVKSLFRWLVDPSEHEKIIATLVEEKFVDEKRYTQMYVSEKHNFYKWGRAKIVSMLRMKGVPLDIINDVCDEIISENPDREILMEQIVKKAKKLEPIVDVYKARVKLFQWSYSKGFSVDDINFCLDRYFSGKEE